jgi:TolB-like protein/DNA-binding winged helix-turn-helix (wHTH) protein/Flp pilus assembly protein TadD
MAGVPASSRFLRFDDFEVDLRSGELRQHGSKVSLQPQPFQLLALLLEHPGELVTREEIRQSLWCADTFVDFEHSLNTSVMKLREALGEGVGAPRFIETLPRHGYRFMGKVERIGALSSLPATEPPRHSTAVEVGPGLRGRLAAHAGAHGRAPARVPRFESIAVLPLENLSRDPEQEYFADGLTDALITDLGKVAGLRVISRTSVMQYKGAKKPLPQIARELKVDAVVEGTVLRSGNRVRVTAQLLDARTDCHLWSESYERDAGEIIRLEEQTALAIAHAVSGRLTTDEETRLASKRTVNPRAYDAYLHGRYLWNERTAEAAAGARAYFEQALREDPNFALAYSGLADCYAVSWWVKMDLPLAEKYARKAVALAPDLAQAHASLGIACGHRCKFAEAEKELQRAIDLNPNYAMAHQWYSLHQLALGRLTEALALNDRALQLDPFSLPVNHVRGVVLIGLRQFDRAAEQAQKTVAIGPQSPAPRAHLARIYWIEGRIPDALAEERKAATLAHDEALLHDQEEVAAAYAQAGPRAAQLKAAQVRERGYAASRQEQESGARSHDFYSALFIAFQYGLLKDKGKVLDWLDQGSHRPSGSLIISLKSAPEFDFVRSDPRFHSLLRRMNFPP